MKRLYGLKPIVDTKPLILILGTFPGCESLLQEKYYAHGTNKFWDLLFKILKKEFSKDYEARKNLLSTHKIALWDLIASCFREGASDKNIIDPQMNPLDEFIIQYPTIEVIFFNGQKAQNEFNKKFPAIKNVKQELLISSSSGTIGITKEEKIKDWEKINSYIN